MFNSNMECIINCIFTSYSYMKHDESSDDDSPQIQERSDDNDEVAVIRIMKMK